MSSPTSEQDFRDSDIVIFVTGVVRSGRSTFINALCPPGINPAEVGDVDSYEPCTREIRSHILDLRECPHHRGDYRLVLVDTPGFDDPDPERPDVALIKDMKRWLTSRYPSRLPRGGVVYLHDSGLPLGLRGPPLHLLQSIFVGRVLALAATKSEDFEASVRQILFKQLHQRWQRLLSDGATLDVLDLEDSRSAWTVLRQVLVPAEAQPLATDIVLIVTGLVRSGRSTFINALRPGSMEVGESGSYEPCTTQVNHVVLDLRDSALVPHYQKDHRLVLVDTPGLDHPTKSDEMILADISKWVSKWYPRGGCHGGILYLHDISDDRYYPTTLQPLEPTLRSTLQSVTIVTTKWEHLEDSEGERRQHVLRSCFRAALTNTHLELDALRVKEDAWRIAQKCLEKIEFKSGAGVSTTGKDRGDQVSAGGSLDSVIATPEFARFVRVFAKMLRSP